MNQDTEMNQTFDILVNKKTKPSEKLSFLKSISFDGKSDQELLSIFDYVFYNCGDRDNSLLEYSVELTKNMLKNINPFLIKSIVLKLLKGLDDEKSNNMKLNTLRILNDVFDMFTIKNALEYVIEPLSYLLADHNEYISVESSKLYEKLLNCVDNKDLNPLVTSLLDGLKNPNHLAKTIDSITSTTFVQVVDSLTLNAIVPLLMKTFKDSKYSVKRQTIIIIENMTKLVEDEFSALEFIEKLIPFVENASKEISEPEVRNVSDRVCIHLEQIRRKGKFLKQEFDEHFSNIKSKITLNKFESEIFDSMYRLKMVTPENLHKFLDLDAESVQLVLNELSTSNSSEEIDSGKLLCDITFTLGYGSKVLLHQTKMKLHKGYKYGLIGPNNSGKTTLMRAMATQQLESFPTDLKCVFVETDILGELSHLSLIEYIKQDKRLEKYNLTEDIITNKLYEMKFTDDMIRGGVSSLSGGWRMKLALTRALMQDADILLMDEPTAHLDVINVKWLLEYINSLENVTCIIVSQNIKLLNICNNIIQIKNLKLYISSGNIDEFLKKNPEAQSYFELSSEKYKFSFPNPRFLEGVKSKGKALLKMDNVTFTYPGNTSPTIRNASVQVSMSSRIGCLGPNGAGKSTSIKILTGQLEPSDGSVWSYPGVKFGYIAQHAFAHIENHLEKTPNEYIRWRYEGGEDKEDLKKASMQMTQEDMDKLNKEIFIEQDGKKVKKTIKRLTYGRKTGKLEREYEVELENSPSELNQWLKYSELEKRGYEKLLKVIDIKCDAAENMYQVALTQQNVEDHLDKVGMNKETSSHVKIKHLSNGDKVKTVIGAALWMLPHILILDEPTNNIDRDGLAALADAIREFDGGIVIITHDEQFCNSVCREIWVIENTYLNIKGDPDWMKNATSEKIQNKAEEEMNKEQKVYFQIMVQEQIQTNRPLPC